MILCQERKVWLPFNSSLKAPLLSTAPQPGQVGFSLKEEPKEQPKAHQQRPKRLLLQGRHYRASTAPEAERRAGKRIWGSQKRAKFINSLYWLVATTLSWVNRDGIISSSLHPERTAAQPQPSCSTRVWGWIMHSSVLAGELYVLMIDLTIIYAQTTSQIFPAGRQYSKLATSFQLTQSPASHIHVNVTRLHTKAQATDLCLWARQIQSSCLDFCWDAKHCPSEKCPIMWTSPWAQPPFQGSPEHAATSIAGGWQLFSQRKACLLALYYLNLTSGLT